MYQHSITVPFGHCDIAGIVWTPRFTDYCMEAAEQFMKARIGMDWYAINVQGDYANPVMGLNLDFHQTVTIGDELTLVVSVNRIGRSSFTLRIVGCKPGLEEPLRCFVAELVLAIVDLKAKKSIPIPAQYRQDLEAEHVVADT